MSSTIDWSKAPEGATHCVQGSVAPWEKRDGDDWYFFRERYHDWVRLLGVDTRGDRRIEVSKLTIIERPTEPQEPTPWNGEGLPPVGTACEFYCGSGYVNWRKGTIFAIKTNANGRVDALIDFGGDWSFSHSPDAFRPYKSDEQIAAEERSAAIQDMAAVFFGAAAGTANDVSFGALYDAGYRKVEQP